MKKLSLAVASIMFTSLSAMAVFNPSWQRPILSAKMTEVNAQGQEINHGRSKEMTLHKLDGAKQPTQISYKEEVINLCPMIYLPGQRCSSFRIEEKKFVIESMKQDSCRAVTYVGRELMDGRVTRSSAVVTLVDHTKDICEYVLRASWEAKISSFTQGLRSFYGNAEAVITIQ